MEELLKLLKEYNEITGKEYQLLFSVSGEIGLLIIDSHTLSLDMYYNLGNLNSKNNDPARTLEKFIRAVKTANRNKDAGRKALFGEE